MRLPELRAQVFAYARQLASDGLAHGAQGNISAIDRESGLIAVTPSAADYATMTADDIVIVDREGAIVEGRWSRRSRRRCTPSSIADGPMSAR